METKIPLNIFLTVWDMETKIPLNIFLTVRYGDQNTSIVHSCRICISLICICQKVIQKAPTKQPVFRSHMYFLNRSVLIKKTLHLKADDFQWKLYGNCGGNGGALKKVIYIRHIKTGNRQFLIKIETFWKQNLLRSVCNL